MAQPTPLHGKNGGARNARRTMHYTRRRLRGRQPLCGIGVTSRIDVIVKPAACKARSADSRPEPGPATSTSRVRMPCSWAFLATSSPATWAAYGRRFARPLETHGARRRPRDRIALGVRNRDHRIVERRIHVGDAGRDVLAFPSPDAGSFFTHSRPFRGPQSRASYARNYFFLPAIAFAGPLRVRALVCVR